MAGNMEDLLMGGGSDSDDSDDNKTSKTPAPSSSGAAGSKNSATASASAPPPSNSSKSDLTNRLKSLYSSNASPSSAPQKPGSSSSTVAPNALPRGGIQVPGLPSNRPPPAPAAPYNHSMPPPAPQQPQQPNPGYQPHPHLSNRMPAPLPKGRSNARSAPPANRVASVPQGQGYHQQPPHHSQQQQQPPSGYHPSSRPPHPSSNYPPQHHQPPPSRSSSSRSSMPPPSQQPPPKAQQRSSMTQQPQMQQRQQTSRSSSSSRSSSATAAESSSGTELTDAEKKEKEKFLMFTRVLMKYLEQRDKEMHQKAKAQIKECYEKNKNGDPEFKSLTQSMRSHLKKTVGETYWQKAHDYLEHFFRQKQETRKSESGGQSSRSSSQQQPSSSSVPSSTSKSIVQPSSRNSQAAAMKMPLAPGNPSSTSGASAPTSAQLTPQQYAEEAAKKEKEEKKEKARLKRLAAKKKREEEQRRLKMMGKQSSGGIALPSIALADPSIAGGSTSTPGATPSSIGGSSVSTTPSSGNKKDAKSKKGLKHSSSVSSTGSAKKKSTTSKEIQLEMEQLDHAVMIDVKSLPNLLSKEFMSDVDLNQEQRKLLYGDTQQAKVKQITNVAANILNSETLDAKLKEKGVPSLQWSLPSMYLGWSDRNVVSARSVWSKVRLPEREDIMIEREKDAAEKVRAEKPMGEPPLLEGNSEEISPPLVTGSMSTQAPVSASIITDTPDSQMLKIEDDVTNHVWYNEARASLDPTLALLSEATELFLKKAIEKAISNARLRQNLDGVRLWSTLQTRANPKNSNVTDPPPALIRLGCDVRRQVALAEGNAAKIYQRMEEAISRQNNSYDMESVSLDPDSMIAESTSMADLSRKPPLKSAVTHADALAKRKFEVYSGKYSNEPPFGRVPKQAKVTLQDMDVGSMGNRSATNRARKMNMMASLFS